MLLWMVVAVIPTFMVGQGRTRYGVTPDTLRKRTAYYERIGGLNMTPLWEVLSTLVPPQPRSPLKAALMLKDRVYGIKETLFHDPYYQRHMVGIPIVRGCSEDGIRCEANYPTMA